MSCAFRMTSPYSHPLHKLWRSCYVDKKKFGQHRILMTKQDILWFLNEHSVELSPKIHIVPVRPNEPLSRKNAVFINKKQRPLLISIWRKSKNEEEYKNTLKNCLIKNI